MPGNWRDTQGGVQIAPTISPEYGALVISLDFELLWGVFDSVKGDSPYMANIRGAREVIPKMLSIFSEYGISATWAIVGFLFAETRAQREWFAPELRPEYIDERLNPYAQYTGENEGVDPFHYASALIEQIARTPRQEIATHTFSHYYCLEPGQTLDAFEADLQSAVEIANQLFGVRMKSIVFPRNQVNKNYINRLGEYGIRCYRGAERYWFLGQDVARQTPLQRALRLVDNYVNLSGSNVTSWDQVFEAPGLYNVAGSRFLRPHSERLKGLEPLRYRRIVRSIREAATTRKIYHLWWHPHNFGIDIEENLTFLRRVLDCYTEYNQTHGLQSLSMSDVLEAVGLRPVIFNDG